MPPAASSEPQPWRLEPFATDVGVEPFTAFADDLDDFTFVALDAALRLVSAARGLDLDLDLDLVRIEWLKPLGEGLQEFRIRHDAAEITQMFGGDNADEAANAVSPPRLVLLRVFVHFYGERVILLLSGYDKADEPSERRQQREIAEARKYLTAWQEQQRNNRKAGRRRGAGPKATTTRSRRRH